MTVNHKGEVVDYRIAESVIRVDRRMTYTSVAKILEKEDPEECAAYEEFVPMFRDMAYLSSVIREKMCIRDRLKWIPVWDANHQNYILPVIALAAYPMAYITRLTKTSMLDVMGQDYVRTARAKGVARWKVIFKHTLRNALILSLIHI